MGKLRNILLVTSLYPTFQEDNRSTPVCHFFARDWIKLGYNVVVIHIQPVYPWYTRFLINIRTRITGVVPGGGYYYKNNLKNIQYYEKDDVPIYRIPVRKLIPRMNFSDKSLNIFSRIVNDLLEKRKFKTDIITGHMIQLDLIPYINRIIQARTCYVSHGSDAEIKSRYSNYIDIIDSYNIWGFRSKGIKLQFEKLYEIKQNSFICYSGIPASYITEHNQHTFDRQNQTFLFVGDFIQRKYPDVLVKALCRAYPKKEFGLSFVGNGPLQNYLESCIIRYGLQSNVRFYGRIPRDEIKNIYDKSDIFVMVSYGEAFGLVYLEAMARGCITVASRNEGIDGIIVDGENGFLCEAGNVDQLVSTIRRINNLSLMEKRRISQNAIITAKKYTDLEVAKMYVNNLVKI